MSGKDDKKDLTALHELSSYEHDEEDGLEEKFAKVNPEEKDLEGKALEDEFDFESETDPNIDTSGLYSDEEVPPFESEEEVNDDPPDEIPEDIDSQDFNFQSEDDFLEENIDEELEASYDFPNESDGPEIFADNEREEEPPLNSNLPEEEPIEPPVQELEETSSISGQDLHTGIKALQEIKEFMDQYDIGSMKKEGNPPYSVLICGIEGPGQQESLLAVLEKYEIITDQNRPDYTEQLEHGRLLVSQISEYSAIYLANQLRKFPFSVSIGLSGDIFQSNSYERDDKAHIGSEQIYQNKEDHKVQSKDGHLDSILVSNNMEIPNYKIEQYFGLSHQNYFFSHDDLIRLKSKLDNHQNLSQSLDIPQYLKKFFNLELGSDSLHFQARFKSEFNQIFKGLVAKMSDIAIKEGANALIGVQFQVTPMKAGDENGYMLNATGSMVKVTKHEI